jgi:ABC-type enterochelin transport system substrate-binding protein
MKRFTLLASVAWLVATVVFVVGCTAQPAASPMAPMSTGMQNVSGILKTVTKNAGAGGSLTVQTAQGNTNLAITPNTTITLEGKVCTVDQLAALQIANVSYNCTSVVYMDENGQMVTQAVNVTKVMP